MASRPWKEMKADRNQPQAGKISGACAKGKCVHCFTLSCGHDCHTRVNAPTTHTKVAASV